MRNNHGRKASRISVREASRAIYIDFEGLTNETPTLCGVQCDGIFEQIVYDEALASAAENKQLAVLDFEQHIVRLLSKCDDEKRAIVAFSEHELNKICEHVQIDISHVYRNANKIAKRWQRECRPQTKKCKGLKEFLELIGFERRPHLGEKKSTARIRTVREQISNNGHYDSISRVAKAKWTKLLEHNKVDCLGMEKLIKIAAREIGSC